MDGASRSRVFNNVNRIDSANMCTSIQSNSLRTPIHNFQDNIIETYDRRRHGQAWILLTERRQRSDERIPGSGRTGRQGTRKMNSMVGLEDNGRSNTGANLLGFWRRWRRWRGRRSWRRLNRPGRIELRDRKRKALRATTKNWRCKINYTSRGEKKIWAQNNIMLKNVSDNKVMGKSDGLSNNRKGDDTKTIQFETADPDNSGTRSIRKRDRQFIH